jgi:hypothetical protein
MTFTAKMAEVVAKHRILVYALMTLALTAYLVIGFTPANAAGAVTQPYEAANNAMGNCSYLTFCRWTDLSQTGQPPIIGLPQLFIVNQMFMLGHFVFFVIGQSYIFVENLNIYYSLLYFGDSVFAKMSVVSASGGLSVGSLIGTVLFAALIIAAFMFFPMLSKKFTGSGMSPGKTVGWMVAGIVILSVMSTASAKNHNGQSPIAQIANNESVQSIQADSVGEAAKNPASWQPYSLGWVISWGNKAVGLVGNIAVGSLTTLSNSMDIRPETQNSACDIYIDSMHNLYTGGSNTNVNSGVLGVEKLYRSAVLDQYVTSNFGSSRGAQDAWCRNLEVGKLASQQVAISANAKNVGNGGHALYQPALGVMATGEIRNGNNTMRWVQNDKSSISDNPLFMKENFGAGLAISYFSPPKSANALAAHSAYFAMCLPQGDKLLLNSEWAGVIQSGGKDATKPLSDLNDKNGDPTKGEGKSVCTAMANGDISGMPSGDLGTSVAVGFYNKATDSTGDGGSNGGKTDYQQRITYSGGSTANPNIMSLLFNGGSIDKIDKFISAEGGLSGPAYSYYAISTGILWGGGFLSACIMVFVSFLIAKIAIPVVLGGAAAQFFGAAAMMLISFTLVAMIVWPSRKIRGLNIRTLAVVVAGSLVSTVFTAIFLVYAGLFSFVNSVLSVRQGVSVVGPQVVENIANGVSLLLAGLISYSLIKILLSKVLKFDPTNIKSALGTSTNAVLSPLGKENKGVKDIMSAPFKGAMGLVKTPVEDTRNQWNGLRKMGDSVKDRTSTILDKGAKVAKVVSDLSPQGATSTKGAGTDADPLVGRVFNPAAAGAKDANGAFVAGAGSATGNGPFAAGTSGSAGSAQGPAGYQGAPVNTSNMSDEQHRMRLMDQLKSAYGTADAAKVFPNGIPADYSALIASASLEEVKRLSKMLDTRMGDSNEPRANQQQAADNMRKFNDMGADALRTNPNGFDPSVGYAERAATQAQLFRGVNPLSEKDVEALSDTDKRNVNSRKFDLVGGVLPEGRSVSFGNGSDVIKGEVVPDPLTNRSVPNGIVRSGSQNLAAMEGVTQDGTSLFGAKRSANADGTSNENWGLSTLDSGARQLPSSVLSSKVPPTGVAPEAWRDVNDLHEWIKQNNIQADSTAMSTWPQPRREQADRVGNVLGSVMQSQGVPMVNPANLELLAGDGVGITSDDDSFSFGEKTPNSDFNPSGMREAITSGKERMAEMSSESMKRAELLMGAKVETQLESVKNDLAQQELALAEKLSERSSLVNNRAEVEIAGLIESLSATDSVAAQEVVGLASSGKWDEITELLSGSSSDADTSALRDQIRDMVSSSSSSGISLDSNQMSSVAEVFGQLREDRESAKTALDLTGLVEAMRERNSRDADQIDNMVGSGKWDEIVDLLSEKPSNDDDTNALRDQIREMVSSSSNGLPLNEDSMSSVTELYEQLRGDRASANNAMQLTGLVEALAERNAREADQVDAMLTHGNWDEIVDLLSESSSRDEDESANTLRDQIRDMVSSPTYRSLGDDHMQSVSELYTQLTEDREAATRAMQLSGLVEALTERNAREAAQVDSMLTSGKWDEIADLLHDTSTDDEQDDLREQILNIVEASKERELSGDDMSNVSELYAQFAGDRESVTNAMHLSELIEALAEKNSGEADQIGGMLTSGKWDEIVDLINDSSNDGGQDYALRDQIRDIVESSKERLQSLERDHSANVAQLYARLANEREAITEEMHRNVEADLEVNIERNADSVRGVAFAGASETSLRHVEGMLSWFPAIKSKFFSGNDHADHADIDAMDDADSDGVDDRLQAHL